MTAQTFILALSVLLSPAQGATATVEDPDADAEARVAAVSELDAALLAWEDSCSKPGTDGLCVRFAPPPSAKEKPAQMCSAPRMGTAIVTSRGKAGKRAYADLVAGLKTADALQEPASPKDKAAYAAKLARARVAVADHDLEVYLALRMPTKLDFVVEEWKRDSDKAKHRAQYKRQAAKAKTSVERFSKYFKAKTMQSAALSKAYASSKLTRDADVVVAAALKTAWVFQHFADELRRGPVPKSVRNPEAREAYCGALLSQSEAPEKQAEAAAAYCVENAKAASVTGPVVDECQALHQRS